MIEVATLRDRAVYASKDRNALQAFGEYLEGVFPDATQEAIHRDKEAGVFVLAVDMGEDMTEKDMNDMLTLYGRLG